MTTKELLLIQWNESKYVFYISVVFFGILAYNLLFNPA